MGKSLALVTFILQLLAYPLLAGAAAAPRVALAHGALNARIAPLWIAHEQKFFQKYGVDSAVILVRQIQIMVSGLGTGRSIIDSRKKLTPRSRTARRSKKKFFLSVNQEQLTIPLIKSLRGIEHADLRIPV